MVAGFWVVEVTVVVCCRVVVVVGFWVVDVVS